MVKRYAGAKTSVITLKRVKRLQSGQSGKEGGSKKDTYSPLTKTKVNILNNVALGTNHLILVTDSATYL